MNSLYQMSVQLTMSVAGMTGPAQLALRALQQVAQQASMTARRWQDSGSLSLWLPVAWPFSARAWRAWASSKDG